MLDVVQAFFDKEYISSHPEDTEKITQLKDLMQEQVNAPKATSVQQNSYLLSFIYVQVNKLDK